MNAVPVDIFMNRRLTLLSAAMMIALAACSGEPADTGAAPPEAAAPASMFEGQFSSISGNQVDLAALEGTDVVLWFWAPW